jgi:large subunit ribosomal protein L25
MEEIVLKATPRDITGKQVKVMRRQGQLPAVLYGVGVQPTSIVLDLRETSRILSQTGTSALITLELEGKRIKVLIRERQRNPIGGVLRHLDFHAISMVQKLRIEVPVLLVGESPAVTEKDGVLVQSSEKVTVECLPADIPENVTGDISGLTDIGNALYVRDLIIPANATLVTDPDEMVANVSFQAAEEVEEVVEEVVEETEPEVIERGKIDDAEEASE